MIQIKNLTFSYNQREDRIFFLLNHNDFHNRLDFIVTRKKMIELLNGFDEILINDCDNGKLFKQLYKIQEPLVEEEIKTSNKKETINKNKNQWEKSVSSNELEFTKNKQPLILDGLSYSLNNNQMTFKLLSNKEFLAVSIMDKDMFQRTLSSMMRVIPFVSWGISANILD